MLSKSQTMLQAPLRACCARSARSAIQNQVRNASANTKDTSELHNPTTVTPPTAPRSKSAAPPGTVLKGLGYLQNKPQPVALPDNEYPSWLWKLMEPDAGIKPGQQVEVHVKGQSVHLDKRELRKKNRESIRSANFLREK